MKAFLRTLGAFAALLLAGPSCTDHVAENPYKDAAPDNTGGTGGAGGTGGTGGGAMDAPTDDIGSDAAPDAAKDGPADSRADAPPDVGADVRSDAITVLCTSNVYCEDTQFCDIACSVAKTGACVDTPTECSKEMDPVCGCDGVTYDNDCLRKQGRVGRFAKGACETAPDGGVPDATMSDATMSDATMSDATMSDVTMSDVTMSDVTMSDVGPGSCGGIAGDPCAMGQFCEMAPMMCGVFDGVGTCQDIPEDCLDLYDPVCGCDGKTYSNDCYRRQVGAQKDHDDAC